MVNDENEYDKNYHEIIRMVNECLKEVNKILKGPPLNLVKLVEKSTFKEMSRMEKALEDKKTLFKNLFNVKLNESN